MMKIKAFLKKYKIPLILAVLCLAIVGLSLWQKQKPSLPGPTPTPPKFELVRFYPPQGEQEIALPSTALSFTFSLPVDIETANVIVVPFTSFTLSTDTTAKTLYINPNFGWGFDTEYKITVSISSKDGQSLTAPIDYSFLFKRVTQSNFDERWYP